jgi:hypothetical protein
MITKNWNENGVKFDKSAYTVFGRGIQVKCLSYHFEIVLRIVFGEDKLEHRYKLQGNASEIARKRRSSNQGMPFTLHQSSSSSSSSIFVNGFNKFNSSNGVCGFNRFHSRSCLQTY